MATLLLGNGINNLNINRLSWESLLINLIESIGKGGVINLEKKPFLHIYEEIYTRALKYTNQDESDLKNKIILETKKIEKNDYHTRILDLNFENILTTNYDYNLTPSVTGTNTKESKFSLHRYQEYQNKKIWHIHGEINKPESIMIGYEHYMGSINNIHTNLNKKKKTDRKSWVDIFLSDDIYILGFGLDFGEVDLWWLLSYRNRLIQEGKREENKITYIRSKKNNNLSTMDNDLKLEKYLEEHLTKEYSNNDEIAKVKSEVKKYFGKYFENNEEQSKLEMLEVLGVEVLDFQLEKDENDKDNYFKFYDDVIIYLEDNLNE